jgi:hypothetical protein
MPGSISATPTAQHGFPMFKLYTVETGTLFFADYKILLREAEGKQSVLEIGPGNSTLAFVEAGVPKIVTLEHDPEWRDKAKEKFKHYPNVEVRSYQDEPEAIGEVVETFDIAFVDSPKGYKAGRRRHKGQEDCSRFNTCLLALKHAPVVYLHDAYRNLERATVGRLSAMGHGVSYLPGSRVGIARIERNG